MRHIDLLLCNVLFEKFRDWRNKEAREQNTEGYMIFHNKVLQEIADKQPKTLNELGLIKGLGPKKLAKYGKTILEIIKNSVDSVIYMVEKESEEKIYSVAEYITHLNQILTSQLALIVGEITSLDERERYITFTLRDKQEDALLKCFIWKNTLNSLGIDLKEGLEVKISGSPRIYEKYGTISFDVQNIGLLGEGALKLAFEKLKKRLEQEGYFDVERKKQIPEYVHAIGLITSKYGDAQNDFITHLGDYGFKIHLYDSRVEGLYAIDEIISGIRWFNENMAEIDVLVIARGGGSLESLQTFNSEVIAKAIFGSKIPIISGIGHENDITIADLVADIRASTPTDSARILSDPWRNALRLVVNAQTNMLNQLSWKLKEFQNQIMVNQKSIVGCVEKIISSRSKKLDSIQILLGSQFKNLINEIKDVQTRFISNWDKLVHLFKTNDRKIISQENFLLFASSQLFERVNKNLINLGEKLLLGNPEARLKQGYSIITNTKNKIVKESSQIKIGDYLNMKFFKGNAHSTVNKVSS